MKNLTIKKSLVALVSGAVLALAGCGGTGAGAGGHPEGAQAAKDAQDTRIMLSANSQELLIDGRNPVDLTAVVTNAESGVALAGQTVEFATRDPGVRIEVTSAVTDVTGTALARLHLNGDTTLRDVTILASVGQQAPAEIIIRVSATATNQGAENNNRGQLTVRIGTDNLIEDQKESLSYRKRYAAIVSDSAGIPKANASVSATLRASSYRVGYWLSGADGWSQVFLHDGWLPSEDKNNPGFCDSGEDVNGDGVLTPGNVASYTVESLTNASGVAVLNIVYPKSFAQWAQMQLEVTAVVGGTEGKNAITIPLPILAADVQNQDIAPPSIARPRVSLSTNKAGFEFPIQSGDELTYGLTPGPQTVVSGSPFPYWSADNSTPTCK